MRTLKGLGAEWPTVFLLGSVYVAWLLLVWFGDALNPFVWILLTGILTTFYMSLTHEMVHGHPTNNFTLNRILALPPIGFLIPYERFRDTHLEHHVTGELTDPFDDPESWYLPGEADTGLNWANRKILEFNNTLSGRMLIGPIINTLRFYGSEAKIMMRRTPAQKYMVTVWGFHALLCAGLVWFLAAVSPVPFWQFAAAIYISYSLLLVRTFLEHQAAPDQPERTVIIERSCPLAFLFLYNNLHVVHHTYPGIPWYQLPGFYWKHRDEFIAQNKGYVYPSYTDIFAKYFFRMKEPVIHPYVQNQE